MTDCLTHLAEYWGSDFEIVALVGQRKDFDIPGVNFYELPNSTFSPLAQSYYDYFGLRKLSRQLSPFLWLAFANSTQTVSADRKAVYFQNASPFYKLGVKEAFLSPRFALHRLLLGWIFRINIETNTFVIVQQDWLRRKFSKWVDVKKIIVAHPEITPLSWKDTSGERDVNPAALYSFFYPSFPVVYKNFEVICQASEILVQKGITNFQVALTLDRSVNRYARSLVSRFSTVPQLHFVGLLTRAEVYGYYRKSDCLLFPSKLESWGMPLIEFQALGKAMLVADLPYACETLGAYPKAGYFNPSDPAGLAMLMSQAVDGTLKFCERPVKPVDPPFAGNWHELFETLLSTEAV